MAPNQMSTRVLIISDTHGETTSIPDEPVDLAIHFGDITEGSKIDEYKTTIDLLKRVNAPIKIIIAGNHDWTLDTPMFKRKIADIPPPVNFDLVKREYGDFEEAKQLFRDAEAFGIKFLDEGTHDIALLNGTSIKVYASPYTPSTNDWGFQYDPREGHRFMIEQKTDIVITHGPPKGILDYVDSKRAGCPDLFAAVARARPKLHCFGHIHSSWGARSVAWKHLTDSPSHFTDIDNDKSHTHENLAGLLKRRFGTADMTTEKEAKLKAITDRGYCFVGNRADGINGIEDEGEDVKGDKTLFVNAAIQGGEGLAYQPPWIVEIELESVK